MMTILGRQEVIVVLVVCVIEIDEKNVVLVR